MKFLIKKIKDSLKTQLNTNLAHKHDNYAFFVIFLCIVTGQAPVSYINK
jgi:hypothetical protein